jgi:ATP-dependent Clp protease ATP-binding subunit ClpA
VLLDEVEKAHPEVFNILLRSSEDGICPMPRDAGSTSATASSS